MVNIDFSKKSSGQINVRFFFKSNKNGRKKPDIYLTGPGNNFSNQYMDPKPDVLGCN